MAGKSARHQRIESEMHRVLAELISREVKDPRVKGIPLESPLARQALVKAYGEWHSGRTAS